jgi:Flp pilus assembly protein TadG
VIVLWSLLCCFLLLGVDYGRAQLVKTELRAAIDAAARAAARSLPSGTTAAINSAVLIAGQNTADGQAITLNSNTDVEFGAWDASARSFTVLTGSAASSANAVRVTGRRTAATGNPVRLTFGPMIGRDTCDLQVSAIATFTPDVPMGIIGLGYVKMSGSAVIDSYQSSSGPYSLATASSHGDVTSNGDISLSGGATVNGDATPGPGCTTSGGIVSGSRSPESTPITCPPVSVGSAATTNDNANVAAQMSGSDFKMSGGDAATMPAGTYCFDNFTMSGSSVLTISGPVTIYVTGAMSLSGSVATAGDLPANIKVRVASTAKVTLSGSSALYADIYAPQAPVHISGSAGIYGSAVGASLDITGGGGVHFDESLASSQGSSVSLVQ